MSMREGLRLTSAYTNEALIIERAEIAAVEPANSTDNRDMKNTKTKVYTKTKGNFYVQENTEAVAKAAFTEIINVGK